uniref:Biosynthetic aromatic amino acid aminotransferase alpha n=1 Tax=uncultured bacterium esnapd18 TaxID=1366599 RepID=S5UD60_9BACT|nr:biosynthetic aromatic amino acid aminotransferase alpha [uncultured bacterium esnapd18]
MTTATDAVPVRPALAAIPDLQATRLPDSAVYLDKNELPWPAPPAVIRACAGDVHAYPPVAPTALADRVARFHGVEPNRVAVGAGSATVLSQILHAVCAPDEEVVFAWPGFAAYPALVSASGARPVPVPLRQHRHDLAVMLDRVHSGPVRVVIVCNPHNPTGTLLGADELEHFLDRVPPSVLVVLDEAYQEFVTDPTAPDGLVFGAARRNVVTVRTFSKAYGLAALRAGYCVGNTRIASAVRRCAVPYAVTRAAQDAASTALDVREDFIGLWEQVTHERDRMRSALGALDYELPDSQGNFVWLELGTDATRFRDHCAQHKVIVHTLPGHGVRVSVGRPEHNDQLLAVARTFPDS